MAKGSYGFSLVKTETSRRCQEFLFFASPKYFPENTLVVPLDNQNHPNPWGADRFDFRPRENSWRLHSETDTTKVFLLSTILWVVVPSHILILFFWVMENKLLNVLWLGNLEPRAALMTPQAFPPELKWQLLEVEELWRSLIIDFFWLFSAEAMFS